MPSPFDELMKDAEAIPDAPASELPDRTKIGMDVLSKGGSEPEQRFQRSSLIPIAGRPTRTQFENDVFTFDVSEITGDISKFDDGEDDPDDEEDAPVCGKIDQPPTYPVAVAHFHVRPLSNIPMGVNKWTYSLVRVVPPLTGLISQNNIYTSDATQDPNCDPVSFEGYNTTEFDNDGIGVEGPNMNTDGAAYLNCDLELKPVTQGVYPCTRYKRSDGTYVHWFSAPNDHDKQ